MQLDRNKGIRKWDNQAMLQLMVLPALLTMLIFSYLPMFGIIIAFKEYNVLDGLFGGKWIGFAHFREMFADDRFQTALRNTLAMSSIKLLITFLAPVIFALLLNEIPFARFKKWAQTLTTLPHFLSYVIIATIAMIFLDPKGIINKILSGLGIIDKPIEFLAESSHFWLLGASLDLWQETGWGAIIYLAAIAGINTEIYEAAKVDGAGRLRTIWHINLPAIRGTIMVLLILHIGNIIYGGSNFNQSYLLGNVFNRDASYVLGYYTLDNGLLQMRYAFATAVDLFQSCVALVLLLLANWGAKKMNGSNIF
ncbi:sugar ABC transporter permease [Cohnella sp. WQ 127256]|uniref:ABC transporter permease n=1 Tax=Cohnella sp. WQ 127256 TaxID=2938790 RepID=UPI002118FC4D|nr:ABC transporter permease subunit [Cohnella sp. WQ 127256]